MEAAVRRLLREFGNQLDREVLESVLEICGGDVDQTVAFLRVQNDSTTPLPWIFSLIKNNDYYLIWIIYFISFLFVV